MNTTIIEAEEKWLLKLYEYNRLSFSGTDLPSHDQYHHLRVWYFIKELLFELENAGIVIPSGLPEKLIFAAFFHDIGLTKTLNEEHGKISRLICSDYIGQNNIQFSNGDEELLQAIELHDDKSYKAGITNNSNPVDLYSLLTVCDDLDAFGAIGVFRYLEIYLLRNIPVKDLPERVLQNIKTRFGNFNLQYSFLKEYMIKHTKRYEYTLNFYTRLSACLNNKAANKYIDTGPVEAVNWLIENFVTKKKHPDKIIIGKPVKENSSYPDEFIHKFQEEIRATKLSLQ